MDSSARILLVPTPIGNLGDLTLRGLEALKRADRIACEDTRRSAALLAHHGITGKRLVSLHEHNEQRRVPELIEAARRGETIAVITDAGMPGISDPGYRLVRACIDGDVPFEVLPGASSLITALVASGLPSHAFRFGGFLPVKSGRRRTVLESAARSGETQVFFESPHRLAATLKCLADISPETPVCVARELTKKFETCHRGTAAELSEWFDAHPPKGEIVIVIDGSAGLDTD
jgi:16S rRNA (cytidine1402-2'-O)-methyltransferase